MDSTVLAAIIGGVFAVLGSVATVILTKYFNDRDKQEISSVRRATLSRKWKGTMSQELKNFPELPIVVNISASSRKITGQLSIHYPEYGNQPSQESEFEFQGSFLYDRFFQLNYISKYERRIQFGAAILELSSSGNSVSGKYVGYGALSERVVSGDIELRKVS